MKYGVTGNFLVDPDWAEEQFRELWDFVAKHGFQRAGYTILTPLPGHRALPEARAAPRRASPGTSTTCTTSSGSRGSGRERFFELYAETWRRSILNTSGEKTLDRLDAPGASGADPVPDPGAAAARSA